MTFVNGGSGLFLVRQVIVDEEAVQGADGRLGGLLLFFVDIVGQRNRAGVGLGRLLFGLLRCAAVQEREVPGQDVFLFRTKPSRACGRMRTSPS